MQSRTLILLVATAIFVAAAAGWAVWQRQAASGGGATAALLLPALADKVNAVRAIEITGGKGIFHVVRAADGAWVMPEKSGYSARLDKVRRTVLALAELRTLELRTDDPALYDRLGLGPPGQSGSDSVLVKLVDDAGDELAGLIVGKTKSAETPSRPAEIYVRKPAEARSWLAAGRLAALADPLDWLDREVVRLDRRRVAEVILTHPDGERVRVHRPDPVNEDFTLANVPADKSPVTPFDINAIAGALEAVNFEDVAKAGDIAYDGAVHAHFTTFDGVKVQVVAVRHNDKTWLRANAEFESPRADLAKLPEAVRAVMLAPDAAQKQVAELNRRLQNWAFQVAEFQGKDLTRRMADLVRDKDKNDKPK